MFRPYGLRSFGAAHPGGQLNGGHLNRGFGGGAGDHRGDGWLGAAVLFLVAVVAALAILSVDWRAASHDDGPVFREGSRPMLMTPMPR
ncbi:hypothetical protein [Azospirillum thermophilum]|uniref:Uncharacterized protein n=1 Tax=Azospirillum thermophilum TaxID=2202148 RepID=A0A2S2CR76_9PROT|nr:hypothetical protein [Azospirillum thermophilum]AWK87011.1 hypothetical protein DEW08_12930 [Azospirillum thermophilum]